ncbi:hypothetical protein SAMN05443245_5871 [Paraburkholderia fungorum]|uniref:Uncharacterized protein n=1 Tax=Paraburkholderia fungorum TaxID=134537 RepID=A0A1H1IY67_9BURK|nr:hypothetical protein [Paraburkholderia fungorum]SDR42654.1 hypothetical protein SAMN05443245_5871 [Paraburkholderia fungorum]
MNATVIPFPIRTDYRQPLEPIEELRPENPEECTETGTFQRQYAICEEFL